MNDNFKLKTENFYDSKIVFLYSNEFNQTFVEIDSLLEAIGLTDKQVIFHRAKWLLDTIICKGIREFTVTGRSTKFYISEEKLPYGLSYFNAKSHMVRGDAEFKKRIELFQDEFPAFVSSVFENAKELTQTKDISSATTLPLSREELAAFMMYEEQHVDIIEKAMTSFMQNQTALMQTFINTQSDIQKQFCDTALKILHESRKGESVQKQLAMQDKSGSSKKFVSKNGTKPNNTISYSYIWARNTYSRIEDYAKSQNVSSSKIIRLICRNMESSGIDLQKYREEYKNAMRLQYVRCIDAISVHKDLRDSFDFFMDVVIDSKEIDVASKDNPAIVPNIIYELLTPLVFEGESSRAMQRRVYREMENHLNYTLKELITAFRQKDGMKNASIGYMIANTPELLKLFEKVVKSCL